MIASELLV